MFRISQGFFPQQIVLMGSLVTEQVKCIRYSWYCILFFIGWSFTQEKGFESMWMRYPSKDVYYELFVHKAHNEGKKKNIVVYDKLISFWDTGLSRGELLLYLLYFINPYSFTSPTNCQLML